MKWRIEKYERKSVKPKVTKLTQLKLYWPRKTREKTKMIKIRNEMGHYLILE